MEKNTTSSKRLLSLDILRGITIAAMVLVNNPGTWEHMYTPLDHAAWNGVTPTDFIFPLFMFIMGVSMCFSLKKYNYNLTIASFTKVLRRGILIFLVGIAIGFFAQLCRNGYIDLVNLRFTGVLARLAFCYFIVALIALTLNHKYFPLVIILILLAYTVLLLVGHGFDQTGQNILSRVDQAVLGTHMYHYKPTAAFNFDPEGFFSNIPGIAHVMIGFLVGKMLMKPLSLQEKMEKLFIFGVGTMIVAYLLQYGCPLNKRVWSPTYVLMTCGAGSALLAMLTWILDVHKTQRWSLLFHTIGVNPLFCFVLGDIYSITFSALKLPISKDNGTLYNVHSAICHFLLNPIFGEGKFSSLMYSIVILFLVWCVAEILYHKKIYIKL